MTGWYVAGDELKDIHYYLFLKCFTCGLQLLFDWLFFCFLLLVSLCFYFVREEGSKIGLETNSKGATTIP